jgi:glyoxylase I family protein
MRQTAGGRLNRVHHIAIIAADHQASKWIYCDVLGCELLTEVHRADPHTRE